MRTLRSLGGCNSAHGLPCGMMPKSSTSHSKPQYLEHWDSAVMFLTLSSPIRRNPSHYPQSPDGSESQAVCLFWAASGLGGSLLNAIPRREQVSLYAACQHGTHESTTSQERKPLIRLMQPIKLVSLACLCS